jgi:hypothetical protein
LGKYTLGKKPDPEVKITRGFPDSGIKPGPKLCAQVSELPAQMLNRTETSMDDTSFYAKNVVSFSLGREEPLLMTLKKETLAISCLSISSLVSYI